MHARSAAELCGSLADFDEADGQVEGERVWVTDDRQTSMTGLAGGRGRIEDQLTGDTPAAPPRGHEEIFQLESAVRVNSYGGEAQ